MMNQRTSRTVDPSETRAGISRRAMMTAAPTLGLGAAALGLGADAALATDEKATDVGRLYADWKQVYESPLWQSADADEEQRDKLADSLYDLELEIAAMPSASIEDVYRKLAIADAHEALADADFDLVALANEARDSLGTDAPRLSDTFVTSPETQRSIVMDARLAVPFMQPIWNWPGERVFALCYPATRIYCDGRYVLADGRMVVGMVGPLRIDTGMGLEPADRLEFDKLVIGRVVSLHRLDGSGWHDLGAGWTI